MVFSPPALQQPAKQAFQRPPKPQLMGQRYRGQHQGQ